VDLLLTRDPAALGYAATLPQFQSVPLAWQRIHVLLATGALARVTSLSEEARQALAHDAVRGEAQGARGPFWWQMLPDCDVSPSPPRDQPPLTPRSSTTPATPRRAIWPSALLALSVLRALPHRCGSTRCFRTVRGERTSVLPG